MIFPAGNSILKIQLLLSLMAFLVGTIAQAQTPAQYTRKGDIEAEKGKWDFAFSYYQKASEIDTPSFELTRKYAEAARRVHYYGLAADLYEKNYQKDNGKLDPTGLFWLAMMQKNLGRYEDAQRNFRKFLKKHKAGSPREIIDRAEQEAKSAQWAMNHIEDELACCDQLLPAELKNKCANIDYTLSPFASAINSPESENAPIIFGNYLCYSAYNSGHWSLMQAEIESQDSSALALRNAEPMPVLNDPSSDNANFFVWQDKIFFTRKKNDQVKIMEADWIDGKIQSVHEVEMFNTAGSINTMPCASRNGERQLFFFASDRAGGEGGMDIWYAIKEKDNWTEPVNAGKRVNTPGDEIFPYFADDQLFFSSNWHEGFGGQDIFLSRIEGKTFSPPANLGVRFNSSFDDYAFRKQQIASDYPFFMFASNRLTGDMNRSDQNACCSDLYAVRLRALCSEKDSVAHSASAGLRDLMAVLPVTLYFHNDEPVPDSWDTTTTISYRKSYDAYLTLIPKYLSENSRGLSGDRKEDAESITQDFFELKVKKGMSDLEMFADLLYRELEAGKSVRVSIRGFASPRAQSDYNLNLTKRRTASLVNYLMSDNRHAFKNYIEGTSANGAHLEFTLLPFGEFKSDKSVSDDLRDERGSIYSRGASLERKIEIEKIEYVSPKVRKAEYKIDHDSHDFGIIPKYGAVHHDFVISNSGNNPMQIDSVAAECGCTDPKLDKNLLLPGESTLLHVGFDPFGKKGKDTKHILVYIAGEEPKVITIEAEREK